MANDVTVKFLGDNANLQSAIASSQKSIDAFAEKTVGAFKLIAASWALGEMVQGVKSFVDAAAEAELVENKLVSVILATGGAAGFSSKELIGYASSLQEITTYDDEAIKGGMTLLATFRNIKGDTFKEATRAILDMATVMGGDLHGAAIQVGKALNDPEQGLSALSRVGVSFNDQQKEMIKTMVESGNTTGAQKVILGELRNEFGGAAENEVQTFTGGMKQLQNTVADTAETIGTQLLPTVQRLSNELNSSMKNNTEAAVVFGEILVRVTEGVLTCLYAIATVWNFVELVFHGTVAMLENLVGMVANAAAQLGLIKQTTADIANTFTDEQIVVVKKTVDNMKSHGAKAGESFVAVFTGREKNSTPTSPDSTQKYHSLASSLGIGDESGQAANKKIQEEAEKLKASVRTPLEKANDEIKEINKLLASQAIDSEIHRRAYEKIVDEYKRTDPVLKEQAKLDEENRKKAEQANEAAKTWVGNLESKIDPIAEYQKFLAQLNEYKSQGYFAGKEGLYESAKMDAATKAAKAMNPEKASGPRYAASFSGIEEGWKSAFVARLTETGGGVDPKEAAAKKTAEQAEKIAKSNDEQLNELRKISQKIDSTARFQ